jgi:hypothetical protein
MNIKVILDGGIAIANEFGADAYCADGKAARAAISLFREMGYPDSRCVAYYPCDDADEPKRVYDDRYHVVESSSIGMGDHAVGQYDRIEDAVHAAIRYAKTISDDVFVGGMAVFAGRRRRVRVEYKGESCWL